VLVSISQGDIPADKFQAPAGFTKKERAEKVGR